MHLKSGVAVPLIVLFAFAASPARPALVATRSIPQTQTASRAADSPPPSDEFVGPFSSWTNVRAQHGAIGDGVADDTSALQAALDRLAINSGSPVVFLPAGTYRITKSLSLNYGLGVGVIGEDPERTRIVWDGPDEGTMLFARGVAYSRINRLTFDGRSKAAVAVEQTWDNSHGNFDTGNEYADDRFVDVGYGIHGGFEGFGFAETSVMRNRFIRNTKAAIALGNFNALDLWVWYSLFEDCGVGITNDPGAGNYRVYNSVFRRSKVADLSMQNTGLFSARNNFSIGSKAFWTSGSPINHPATIDIQGNTILDPQSAVVIRMANQGPGLIIDNRIRSLPNTGGPIVSWSTLFGSDVISIGNVFTVSNAVSANGRLVTLDDRIVTRDAIDATEPAVPGVPPNNRRRIFEVAAGSGSEAIQKQIDDAAQAGGERPVVHLPFGTYTLEKTLTIPSDVQLVGDGTRSRLRWSGSGRGPVVSLSSPSRVTLRELQIDGSSSADGVVAAGMDQPGARAYFEGIQLRSGAESNLLIDRAGRARLQFVDVGHAYSPTGTSVQVVGAGPAGPDAPPVVIYSGASSGNRLSYDVRRGGSLVARDIWYEGEAAGGFARVRDGGSMTLQGARVAIPAGRPSPAFTVDTDAARVTVLTTHFDDRLVVLGSNGRADILALSTLREDNAMPVFTNSSAAAARALMMTGRQRSKAGGLIPRGTVPLADVGRYDADFVRAMLKDTRSIPAPSLDPAPPGAPDLRMFRVWITGSANNLVLVGPSSRE